jgi:DNA-binding transcriptional MerR regulator
MTELTIGELARRSGVSTRALRFYDERGLLTPSRRSVAGYRLYGPADIARLQQIVALRQLGFALDDIRAALECPDMDALRLVELQLDALRGQIAAQQALCARLEALADALRADGAAPVETLLDAIARMQMIERHYTPEQLEQLKRRREEVGEERIREVEAEWPRLIEEVRAAKAAGVPPTSATARALARRWQALVAEFTGGDPGIAKSLKTMYAQEPEMRQRSGDAPELFDYIGQALAAERDA